MGIVIVLLLGILLIPLGWLAGVALLIAIEDAWTDWTAKRRR